jgi:hypothetical protein
LHHEVAKAATLALPLAPFRGQCGGQCRGEKILKTTIFFTLLQKLTIEANRQLRIEKQRLSELKSYLYRQDSPANFVYRF